jgi:catecholate siderophore receptor
MLGPKLCRVFAAVCLSLLASVPTQAQDSLTFDIPAGPLSVSVPAFEVLTKIKVDVPREIDLSGIATAGVTGRHTLEDALAILLKGTGLAARRIAPGVYALGLPAQTVRVEVFSSAPYAAGSTSAATKTATPVMDVPQTVTVIPRALLNDQGAQSIADAVRNAPGVTISQGEGNRDQIVLRGISTNSDFFVNGIRDDQERFRDLYNVESVDVVQGPAAVLFGRGGAGGLVNLSTWRPDRASRSSAALEIGSSSHKRATTQLAVPFGARGVLGLSAMGEDSDGFRQGFFLRRYGINPTAGLELGKHSRLVVGIEHMRDHRLADRGIPSRDGRPVEIDRAQLFGSPTQNDARSGVDSVTTSIEHTFGNGTLVRNVFLAGRYDKSYQNVYPGSAVNTRDTLALSAYNHDIDRTNVFSQSDIVAHTKTGGLRHTILAGLEAGRQYQDEFRRTAANLVDVPLSDPVRDADFAAAPVTVDRRARADVLALYLHDQVQIAPHWKAAAGARLDRFGVQVDSRLGSGSRLERTDIAVSPRAGVIFQPSRAVSIYASYASTFLPSGQTLGLATNTAELTPENAKNYEVGAKLDVVSRRLQLAAAAFRLDRNNVKNVDPTDPTKLVLTGQQRAEGVSLSIAGDFRRLRVSAAYAHQRARIVKDIAAAPAGRAVGLVPNDRLSLWATSDVTNRVGLGGGVISQGASRTSFTNQVTLPAYTRTDALVYYRLGRHRLSLNVENLFDARYYPTANGDNNISPGAPRSLLLSLRTVF